MYIIGLKDTERISGYYSRIGLPSLSVLLVDRFAKASNRSFPSEPSDDMAKGRFISLSVR